MAVPRATSIPLDSRDSLILTPISDPARKAGRGRQGDPPPDSDQPLLASLAPRWHTTACFHVPEGGPQGRSKEHMPPVRGPHTFFALFYSPSLTHTYTHREDLADRKC